MTNLSAKGLLILVTLFASSLLAAPEYAECEDLFPDEYMDLSAICKVSQKQFLFSFVATFPAGPSALNYSWSYYPGSEVFSPQLIHVENALATLMRC